MPVICIYALLLMSLTMLVPHLDCSVTWKQFSEEIFHNFLCVHVHVCVSSRRNTLWHHQFLAYCCTFICEIDVEINLS